MSQRTCIKIDHVRGPRWRLRLLKLIFLYLLVASLSACALRVVKDAEEPAVQTPVDAAQRDATIRRQRSHIMQLELRLLSKQSEIQRLSSAREQAIREVVRVKAKLRSRYSMAETVANLAEVKLRLQSIKMKGRADYQVEGLKHAQQYIAMSEVALDERNYDGASYLIGQAQSYLHTSMDLPVESSERNSKTHEFSPPIPMTVTQRCNVRAGPGTDQKILTQLRSGASVLATGYRDLWVRMQRKDGTIGWIHYSLLKAGL